MLPWTPSQSTSHEIGRYFNHFQCSVRVQLFPELRAGSLPYSTLPLLLPNISISIKICRALAKRSGKRGNIVLFLFGFRVLLHNFVHLFLKHARDLLKKFNTQVKWSPKIVLQDNFSQDTSTVKKSPGIFSQNLQIFSSTGETLIKALFNAVTTADVNGWASVLFVVVYNHQMMTKKRVNGIKTDIFCPASENTPKKWHKTITHIFPKIKKEIKHSINHFRSWGFFLLKIKSDV